MTNDLITSPPAAPHERRKARSELRQQKRRAIVSAMENVLLRYRDRATTMDEIARVVGMSTASLYKYFPDGKDELFEELIDLALDSEEEALKEALEADEAPVDQLIAIGGAYTAFAIEHPGFFRFIAQPQVFGPLTEDQLARVQTHVAEVLGRVAEVITRGQNDERQDQRLRRLDADATAHVLHGAWKGLLGTSVRDHPLPRTTEQIVESTILAVDIVHYGLMSRRSHEARAVALDMALQGQPRDLIDGKLQEQFGLTLKSALAAHPDEPRD